MVAVERETAGTARQAPERAITADAIPLRLRRFGGTPRQVLAMTLIGTLVLGVFASRDLSSWLGRMGDGPGLVSLQHAAAEWNMAMTKLHLTGPPAALRHMLQHMRDWEWPGDE